MASDRARRGPRVLFVQYTNPGGYPPILHAAELLREAGCDIRFCGVGTTNDGVRAPAHLAAEVRLLAPAPSPWLVPVHSGLFLLWALWQAATWRAHWIYASDPKACPAAWCAHRLLGVRVIYHEHDSPAPESEQRSLAARLVASARRRLGRQAELCVLPNDARARAFAELVERPDVLTVWNTPLARETAEPPDARPGLRLVYHGSIVPARVPETVVEALAALPDDVTMTVVGYTTAGAPGYAEHLLRRARELGVERRVEWRNAVPRDVLMAGLGAFDAGLALLPVASADLNEREMVGASNKAFDYLAAGLPVIVPDSPAWREAFVDRGVGVACRADSAADIARAIAELRDDPSRRVEMGRRGRQLIRQSWNYETSFAPVLDRVVAGRAAAA